MLPILTESNVKLDFKKTKNSSSVILTSSGQNGALLEEILNYLLILSEWIKVTIFDGLDHNIEDDLDPWLIFSKLYGEKLLICIVEEYLYPKIPSNPQEFHLFSKELTQGFQFEEKLKKLGKSY